MIRVYQRIECDQPSSYLNIYGSRTMNVMKASLITVLKRINRRLIPVKMQYFIFLAALGCALPFRTLFAKQIGLSGAATGAIFTVVPFTKIITNPLFGAISDHFKKFRVIIITILIFVGIFHVGMVFIPPVTPNSKTYVLQTSINYACSHKSSEVHILNSHMNFDPPSGVNISCRNGCFLCHEQQCIEMCGRGISIRLQTMTFKNPENVSETVLIPETNSNLSTLSTLKKDSPTHQLSNISCLCNLFVNCTSEFCEEVQQEEISNTTESVINEFTTSTFWSMFTLIAFSSSTFAAVLFLMDAVCYEILEDKPEKYGQQRLWGTAGWGIGTLLGGYVNDFVTGDSLTSDYRASFYLLAILCIVNIIPLLFIDVQDLKYSKNIFKDVSHLLCNFYIITYMVMVFFVGVLSGLIWNYQMWFMEEIGASPFLQGLSMTAECFLAELPCFIVAGWVVKKIGHNHCTSLTFLCFGLRYLCFAYMQDPWLSIPVGLLHGPTFGIFFASLTAFGKENAPPGTEATVQGLLAVSFEGIGVATGSLLGGIAFDAIGSRTTMWYCGIASFIFLVINVSLDFLLKCQKKQDITVDSHSAKANSEVVT